jgi:hypothetical protein
VFHLLGAHEPYVEVAPRRGAYDLPRQGNHRHDRLKHQGGNSLLQSVMQSKQIIPGSTAFALSYLGGDELNLKAE